MTNPAPPPTASISVWKEWAKKANGNMRTIPYREEAAEGGCTVTDLAYTDLEAGKNTDLPIPAGISLTSVSMVTHCPPGATNPFTAHADSSGTVSIPGTPMVLKDGKVVPVADSTPNGEVQPFDVSCGQITNGRACNGLQTSGGQQVITASYTYQASGTATGHTELSYNVPTTCQIGTLAKNGPDVPLTNGATQLIQIPYTVSRYWVTNWWESLGGGSYSNWGKYCHAW